MSRALTPRNALPALLLVVLGLAVVAWSGFVVYDDFRPDYSLGVDTVDDAPEGQTVRAYENLPPDARDAFDRARDGSFTVHERPSWADTFPYGPSYVRHEGTVYAVIRNCDCVQGLSLFLAVPGALVGLALAGIGGLSYRRNRVRLPLALLVGVGVAWPLGMAGSATSIRVFGTAGVPVVLAAFVVATGGTWVVLRGRDVT